MRIVSCGTPLEQCLAVTPHDAGRRPARRHPSSLGKSLAGLLLVVWLGPLGGAATAAESTSAERLYLQKIKPLLHEKCATCHGPLREEGGLRLDAIQLLRHGGDSGDLLSLTDPRSSELLTRVSAEDVEMRMPPEGEGTALTAEQLGWIESWLAAGAPGPEQEDFLAGPLDHWAFRPAVRPPLNSAFTATQSGKATRSDATPGGVAERSWDGGPSPIDQLLDRAQRRAGVRPLAAAAEAIWLRRVTLDLTGIPPTPQALQEFQRDRSPQRKTRVVDALLASSDYGQRWGRHWMDVWRYSDWDGYKQQLRGSQRHIWHWRDWIIESLNKNKPYDQMIMEMLAGDELAPTDPQVLRATGFIARNYHKSNRNIQLDALVEHTGKAFLGLTFNCAKCHDHKFDPIEQRSFYAMRAVFEPHGIRTDQLPGQSDVALAGLPRAYDAQLDTPTYMFLRGDEKLPLEDDPVAAEMLDWIPSDFQPTPVDLPLESYYPELSQTAHRNQMAEKQQAVRRAYEAWQEGLAKKELPLAEAGAESDIAAQEKQLVEQQRLAFALQVATADSLAYSARYAAERAKYTPSTKGELRASLARVAARVEHEQQRLVGQQKVFLQTQALDAARNSSEAVAAKRQAAIDKASKALSEAEEQLAKLPVTLDCDCEKYTPLGAPAPAKSSGRRLALARWIVDPRNPLTARVAVNHIWMRHFGRPLVENVFDFGLRSPEPKLVEVLDWLACELVDSGWDLKHLHRLIVLSDAYSRASSVGERQSENIALDPDNDLLWRFNVQRLDAEQIRDSLLAVAGELDGSLSGPDIDFELGEKIPRRSLYFRHAYEKQMPMMVLFDAASPNDCYRRRPSIIPQQALVLLNSTLARNMSRKLAARLTQRLRDRESPQEYTEALFLATLSRSPTAEELAECMEFLGQQAELVEQPSQLTSFAGAEVATVPASESSATRARESLALVLFNHNDFVSVR